MNTEAKDLRKIRSMDEQAEFVMSFVEDSDDQRSEMEAIWNEVDDNYLVRPAFDSTFSGGTAFPLDANLLGFASPRNRSAAILKDPETHQEIMTLLSKIVLDVFPVGGGFVASKAVGFEDILASIGSGKLTEHAFRLPGHYWAQVLRILYALLRGTGVNRWTWEYREEVRTKRQMSVNPFTGEIESASFELMVPVWDDPFCRAVDTRDFYPDHGQELLINMQGVAEHYRITAAEAMRRASAGIFDMAATEAAIARRAEDVRELDSKRSEVVSDVSPAVRSHPDFMELDVYEFYGETPFKGSKAEPSAEDGIYRRVISVMNGDTVRSKSWPRRLPYSEVKIIPRPGSFWGLSVGELVRYDQDLADTLKMMLADASVLMTHPPTIYNKNMGVDLQKLRRFNPRVPIGANSTEAVKMVEYAPRLGEAFSLYAGVKGQMRDASSALDSLQGQVGPDRETATGSQLRYQAGQGRPEFFSSTLEREWLPADGRIVFELYQEFLENDEELLRRIGQSELPVSLLDIAGDFDIEFIGSRQQANRVQKIETFREINAAAAANPVAAALVPWVMLYRKWFKDLGAEDIAAMVGDESVTASYMQRSMLLGQGGQQPQTAPASPPGLLPAQSSGVTS